MCVLLGNYPPWLKGYLSVFIHDGSPIVTCPSVFKVPLNNCLFMWTIYPMGKCAVILRGGTCSSAILVAAVKHLCCTCRCFEGWFFVYILYHTVWYFTMGCHTGVKVISVSLEPCTTLHPYSRFETKATKLTLETTVFEALTSYQPPPPLPSIMDMFGSSDQFDPFVMIDRTFPSLCICLTSLTRAKPKEKMEFPT